MNELSLVFIIFPAARIGKPFRRWRQIDGKYKFVRLLIPAAEGTFSGVAWIDPELGRGIETVWNHDFTVNLNKGAVVPNANPTVAGPTQISTNHYHQVMTDKLVSVN